MTVVRHSLRVPHSLGRIAVGFGAVLGTTVLVASGSAQAGPVAEGPQPTGAEAGGVVGLVQPHAGLQVDLGALEPPAPELPADPPEAESQQAGPQFATGDLPGGRAVPMKDFRVGPLYGRVGGPHTGGVHSGLDMGADHGTPIHAIAPGKVEVAGWQGAAGNAVTILTESGKRILYGHMSSLAVKQGQRVEAGQRIGAVGSTGNSTGPHLHLGVNRPDGASMDPLIWLEVSARELAKHGRD